MLKLLIKIFFYNLRRFTFGAGHWSIALPQNSGYSHRILGNIFSLRSDATNLHAYQENLKTKHQMYSVIILFEYAVNLHH